MLRERGFTLLEVLVVMVLMGLLSAAAMTTINYAFTDDTAEKHSERLAALIELAAEEALLTGRELGMRIDDDGYSFFRFEDRQQAWTPIDGQKVFRNRPFPEHIDISLQLEGQQVVLASQDDEDVEQTDNDFSSKPPQVMFFSSGQSTPFELDILDTRDDRHWRLTTDLLGRVERIQVE